jgi:putative heme-binding domain-containing protein
MRAIEILTELFGGLNDELLKKLSRANSADVRARAVWSLGRIFPTVPDAGLLLPYLDDEDPLVVRLALESLLGIAGKSDLTPVLPALARQLGSRKRFVRQAAARIVPKLSPENLKKLATLANEIGPQAVLSMVYGLIDRRKFLNKNTLSFGSRILRAEHPPALKLEAVRLMQLALGDVGPRGKRPAVFDGYSSRIDLSRHERDLDPVRILLADIYPTGHRVVDMELSRLMAMLTTYNAKFLYRVLEQITAESHPVDDIHHLIVAARVPMKPNRRQRDAIVDALVQLDPKILSRQLHQDRHWDDRIGEMYKQLVKHDPGLPAVLARHPKFGRPGHVIYLSELPKKSLKDAVAAFVKHIESDDEYPWTNDIVFVLGESGDAKHRRLLREQFENFSLRSAVLMVLAREPSETDREKFVEGLNSSQLEVLTACVAALAKLPAGQRATEQFSLLRTLRRLGRDNREYPLREQVVNLLRRNTGRNFGFQFGTKGSRPQMEVIGKWTAWISRKYPDEATRQLGAAGAEAARLKQRLAKIDGIQGDAARGGKLFQARSCSHCHGGRRALGPDLAGVARRFSREDLFTAIAIPNRDVSPRYQTTLIQTIQGKVYTGLVIYQSVDGLILRNATNQTFRIEADDIEIRRTLNASLMPAGLLNDLKPRELADLYAYIRSLGIESSRSK